MTISRLSLVRIVLFLVAFGASLPAQEDATELVERLGGKDVSARYPAYQTLRSRPSPAVLGALRKALPRFDASAQSLGMSLVLAYGDPERSRALRGFLSEPPGFLRLSAAVRLRTEGDASMTRHIVACLKEPGPPPALGLMLGRLWNVTDPEVMAAVEEHVTPATAALDLAPALRVLARAKVMEASGRAEAILAADGLDPERRALAAAFLLALGRASAGPALISALPALKSWQPVQSLLILAAHLDESVLAAILERARGQKGHDLRYSLDLLRKHDYPPAVKALRAWLRSDDATVARHALEALVEMGEGLPRKELVALLDSEDEELRVTAADSLRRMDDDSGLPRLIDLVEKGSKARRNAVQALGKFRRRRVASLMITLLDDADAAVRQEAFAALPSLFRSLFPYRRFDFAQTGYAPSAAPAARRAAVARIGAWWKAH